MRKQLLNEINDFAKDLQAISKWPITNDSFGHVNSGQDDYIFEFYCYVKILHDLRIHQLVTLVPGKRNDGITFPKKPAKKSEGWARFNLSTKDGKSILYQVCAGTGITLSSYSRTDVHPDISFQLPASGEQPTEKDAVMVMDAKFKKNNSGKFDLGTIHEFMNIVRELGVEGAPTSISLTFDNLVDLKANCLFTNAGVLDKQFEFCKSKGIRQVGRVGTGKPFEIAG